MNLFYLLMFVYVSLKFISSIKSVSNKSYEEVRAGIYRFEILKYIPVYFGLLGLVHLSNYIVIDLEEHKFESSFVYFGSMFVSSLVVIILAISFVSIFIIVKYRKNRKVFWSVVVFSSVSIGVTIVDTILRIEEFNLIKSNTIEHQEFNLFSLEKMDEIDEIDEIKDIVELSTIDNFASGDHHLPSYDWGSLEQKIEHSYAKVIILSGFTDPHKIRSGSNNSNRILAYKRALSVQEKIKKMELVKNKKIPVFVMSNGIEYGVKLFDYQISEYSTERKVKVYVGI